MKCYYDILDVDRLAPTDLIKKAYYKLSLKWHPDKNPNNIAEATEIFQEIQRAYKVLSNPQERTWYDKNRERFLSMNFNSEDELYELINNIIYQGFENDENGFYAVHEHIFGILIEREHESCRIRGEVPIVIPNFGNSLSDYREIVGPFYSFWESFSTKMSFHWKNKHDIHLSLPRDVRRAMEKENSEERTSARKEYNKAVQNLIGNLKLRDPRTKLWRQHLDLKAKDNEKKAARMAQKAWERSRQNVSAVNAVPSYGGISVEELEDKLNRLEIDHGKTLIDHDSDQEEFYCVACNKYFKSFAAFGNHEKSKNHNKNLTALRRQMMKENENYFVDVAMEDNVGNDFVNLTKQFVGDDVNEAVIIDCGNAGNDGAVGFGGNVTVGGGISEDIGTDVPVDGAAINCEGTAVVEGGCAEEEEADTDAVRPEKKRRRKPKWEKTVTQNTDTVAEIDDNSLACDHCGMDFVSRNKLFQHVKSVGHETIKTNSKKSKAGAKKK